MDNKDIEFFDFDDEFNLDDLNFKSDDESRSISSINNIESNNQENINVDSKLIVENQEVSSQDNYDISSDNLNINIEDNEEITNYSTQDVIKDSNINEDENNNIEKQEKKEELENPVVEMINNKTTMKLIIIMLVVLFVAVIFMPKLFELLNEI